MKHFKVKFINNEEMFNYPFDETKIGPKPNILQILANNGIDDEYLENNDNEVEGGTNEWMDVISEITGKNPYETDTITSDDYTKVGQFIDIMSSELCI